MNTTTHPLDPDELVELRFVLPARHAPGVQATIQRYLASTDAGGPGGDRDFKPPFGSSDGPKDAWELPDWEESPYDVAAMNWIVNDLSDQQLDVLHGVINMPGSPTSFLVTNAGYPEGTAASPVFRAIGSRFRRVGRRPLWTGGEKTPDGQQLGVTSNLIAIRLFLDAAAERANPTMTAPSTDPSSTSSLLRQALEAVELTEKNKNLIAAFRESPDRAATAGDLAERLGFTGYGGANFAIGALGKRIADELAILNPSYTPAKRPDGSPMWWHVVATGEIRDDNLFWWTLRPEFDQVAT